MGDAVHANNDLVKPPHPAHDCTVICEVHGPGMAFTMTDRVAACWTDSVMSTHDLPGKRAWPS